jgi:hypothetical protein
MKGNPDLYTLAASEPPQSPAWSLVDAFDAVTNGMEDPGCFSQLDRITEARFQPWKALIRGIRALYGDDPGACQRALDALEDDSPPAVLKPLFRAWLSRQGREHRESIFEELSGACDSVADLYRRLLIEPHPLSLLAEQADEALRHGLEEQFAILAGKVMRALGDQRGGPLLALRYARYCLDTLDQAGYGGADFFFTVIRTLGEADGFCALAFALIGKDDRAAAAALEKALAAGDGRFLDPPMAALIGEWLPALKSRGERRRAEGAEAPGQLDLFGEAGNAGDTEKFGDTGG